MATASTTLGRRIAVVGASGCGKTFVARTLARQLEMPQVHNDAMIWRPGWRPAPRAERAAALELATRGDVWVFDGNLSAAAEEETVVGRCDTLVWLDLPRWQVLWQVTRRTLGRVTSREPIWHGNVLRWHMVFTRGLWSLRSFGPLRTRYRTLFADPRYADRARIRLRSRQEVDSWLAGLQQEVKVPS